MKVTTTASREMRPTYKLVSSIYLLLPVALLVIAVSYETVEHILVGRSLPRMWMFSSEVVFFGILGPACVALVLGYLRGLLRAQIEDRLHLEEINRGLESTVAERTRHVEEARSELQRNNEALARANAELRQLDQMKSEFVALVSHSLRGPLTNLNGALELIGQDKETLPKELRGTFSILAEEGIRLQHLVRTILDVSRLEAGRLKMNLGPVALEPLLSRVVAVARATEPKRPISLDVSRGLPPAWADETYVEEVIRNLLSNATKYSPQDSPVEVTALLDGDVLLLSVTDHGPGIPLEHQAQIFRAFQRTEVGERRDTSGLGLGLYFASKLVEAQQGHISVESPVWADRQALGARFVIALPIAGEVPDVEEIEEVKA